VSDRLIISQSTIDEVARVSREWPDGIHTCAELQRTEPGRRPCTCGRCPSPRSVQGTAVRLLAEYREMAERGSLDYLHYAESLWMSEAGHLLEQIAED
jgi:hypothetical protein